MTIGIADEPVLPEGMQYAKELEDTCRQTVVDKAMDSIRFQHDEAGAPVPVIRLEVEFDEKGYLHRLATEARHTGLITGFTIEPREANYEWRGKQVRRRIFVLRTTIPEDTLDGKPIGAASTALAAYQFFYSGIKDRWEVPLVYVDRSMAVNPDAAGFLINERRKAQRRKLKVELEPSNLDIWTYGGEGIHLWDGGWATGVVGVSAVDNNTHRILSSRWTEVYDGSESSNPHLAVVSPTREYVRGQIVPGHTVVSLYSVDEEGFYAALSSGKGLKGADRRVLMKAENELRFVFPYRE